MSVIRLDCKSRRTLRRSPKWSSTERELAKSTSWFEAFGTIEVVQPTHPRKRSRHLGSSGDHRRVTVKKSR